jgi:hypothetical protein
MTSTSRSVVVAAAMIVAAVVVASPLHTPLNNPNEGVRVYTARAIVEQHTLAIDAVSRDWGFIDDKAKKDGRTYQSKAPLPALLGAAAYAVVHPVTGDLSRPALTRLCRLAVMVPVALMLALCWWALRRPRGDTAFDDDDTTALDVVMLGLVTGTGVLATLQVFSGHALAAIAPAAILALARRDDVRGWHHVVAGALFGVAASSEYPAALSLPLVWLVTRRDTRPWRALGLAVVGGVVALLPTLVAHQLMWGAPWRTGYSFLDNPHYRPLVEGTFFGIGLPDPRVWATTLLSPELGLIFFSPFLALGVVGVLSLPRSRRVEQRVVIAVVVAYLLFIGGFRGWRGGWSVGPRYILELAGILAVFVIDGARSLPPGLRWPIVLSGVGVGVLHSGLAGAFFPHLPDVLRAPVGELVLPLVWRGFAPDSIPLALGLSSSTSAAIVALLVLGGPVLVGIAAGRRGSAVVAVIVVAVVAVVEVHAIADGPTAGREVRRVTDNWRPESGIPWRGDVDAAPHAVRFALDRGREVKGPIRCDEPARPRRADVGPGTSALRAVVDSAPVGALVVVDDALADHIGPTGGAALVVVDSDLKGRPLPCVGDIHHVGRGSLPPRLRSLEAAAALVDLDDGFVWRRLRRPTTGAP